MIKLTELSQDELKYICERIHFSNVRNYFKNNPEEFAKIRPGFRAETLTDADVPSILVKNANKPFVSTFIEKTIKKWMPEIREHCDKLEREGYSAGEALLMTIQDSVFCDNCELYFKFAGQKPDDYIKLFRDALTLVQKTAEAGGKSDDGNYDKTAEKNTGFPEDAKGMICELRAELELHQQNEAALQKAIREAEDQIKKKQEELNDINDKLQKTETYISEIQPELDHYRYLRSYADEEFERADLKQFQYISIGQISYDCNGQIWIDRLADIVDGEIWQFFADDSIPHCFGNRDHLYWKNGPNEKNAIGIWSWSAAPRATDPSKDFITCEYNRDVKFIEVVEFPYCKNISDVANILAWWFERNFISEKVLFVYTAENGTKEGLLCQPEDLEYLGTKTRLADSVFVLPHYSVKPFEILEIAGIQIYHKMDMGIPPSIFRVKSPCDVVKKLVLSRATNPALREYELTKKEAQRCRKFLEGIPSQTLFQELSDIYGFTEKESQEYINNFIRYSDTYLSSSDLDMQILSDALKRNPELVELCKNQLTDEWEKENSARFEEAGKQLEAARKAAEDKRTEEEQSVRKKDELESELEILQQQIEKKEQLAIDVEKKIAVRIEEAKKNAADFISAIAFISPASLFADSTGQQKTEPLRVFQSHMEYENSGEIDDIDTFEEELAENYRRIGYEEKTAFEMAQAVSFGICNRIPVIIGENAIPIAQCLAATIGGSNLSEIFVSDPSTRIENISDMIEGGGSTGSPAVYLLHGVFDGYGVSLYNALVSRARNWDKNAVVLMSLEGIPAHMVPPGVWNHAIYIDGDAGLRGMDNQPVHAFRMIMRFERTVDRKKYKRKKKDLNPYSPILSNTQIDCYARFLSLYDADLNTSQSILNQMIVAVKSSGSEDKLKSLFHDNGITNGEKMLEF